MTYNNITDINVCDNMFWTADQLAALPLPKSMKSEQIIGLRKLSGFLLVPLTNAAQPAPFCNEEDERP